MNLYDYGKWTEVHTSTMNTFFFKEYLTTPQVLQLEPKAIIYAHVLNGKRIFRRDTDLRGLMWCEIYENNGLW